MTATTDRPDAARDLDRRDPLRGFRDEFLFPESQGVRDLYFLGNSLGLQPSRTAGRVQGILHDWQSQGVRGHFAGNPPWIDLPESVSTAMADLVGARPHEVVVMNTLTVNLHLMLASFYQPHGPRHRILMEHHAFPSDHQAVVSHLRLRGFDERESLVHVSGDSDGGLLDTDRIRQAIAAHGDSLALVLLPGVQYYTGEVCDLQAVTAAARETGCHVGFDLAHAAGNVPLTLHEWAPDFACWCTYKYLNGGPGSLAACFIHEHHATNRELPRLAGWWGHERATRFAMPPDFVPPPTAQGWQLSNPPILSLAALDAAVEVFREAGGMEPLREKSLQLTAFLRNALQHDLADRVRILTPADPDRHGCQLSLQIRHPELPGRHVFDRLSQSYVQVDWRDPDVIRVAPVPLYNSFEDVARFTEILCELLR